jgi:tRNA (adenine37-N6)-methyltransferase
MGIFATRGPKRVNPIGLSLIQLLDVTGSTIRFAGVDLLDGTPVIDLKPYVTRFDRPAGDPRCGWFDQVTISNGYTGTTRPTQATNLTRAGLRPGS